MRENFGEDRQRRLFGRPGPEIESDRPVDPGDGRLGKTVNRAEYFGPFRLRTP